MRYRAVFFDFDYTLGDATDAIHAAFVHALTSMGHPAPDRETVRHTVGMVVTDAYTMLTGDGSRENRERFYALFHPVTDRLQRQGQVALFPGAVELLTALRTAGVPAGLVSTKPMDTLAAVVEVKGLKDLLSPLVGGNTVATHKPHPEGLFWAMEQVGVEKRDVLYCGDTVIDAETAQNAGVDFCAVLNGTTPAGAFDAFPSVHTAPDLWELKSWLGV